MYSRSGIRQIVKVVGCSERKRLAITERGRYQTSLGTDDLILMATSCTTVLVPYYVDRCRIYCVNREF